LHRRRLRAEPQLKTKERSVKKKSVKKMNLSRETVRLLNDRELSQKELAQVGGGITSVPYIGCTTLL
jgi:hypothetical protein